ncbi:CBS domain-containing protein [Streptomyces sp. KM273126]|uniref:CBS domain-containing protein n=1 Tax=Streptomyces sp. KM273126 TaxID=2545247 RepID=UPI002867FD72|nr:CBS domain-containing protein [Streptomyces sp. KM273126]
MKTHTIGEVMTSEVVQAQRETPFKDVVRLLDRHRISGLPVVDHDDKVVGVISGTELVRGQVARADTGRGTGGKGDAGRGGRLRLPRLRRSGQATAARARATTAAQLMSAPAITVHPEQLVPDAARMMEHHGIELLPVVDEEDRLIGIATRRDLLRVFLRTDEEIRRQVTEDVMAWPPNLPPPPVVVHVRDGMVTLEGRLERRSDIPVAVRSTWRIEGVVGVVNSLTYRIDDVHPPEKHHSHRIGHYWLPER